MDTKLSVERLMKIAEVLDAPLDEILNLNSEKIYHQNIAENGIGYQEIKYLYQENQDTIQKSLDAKNTYSTTKRRN